VVIHQIPVSLSLASLLRQSLFTPRGQSIFLVLFALAAPIGFILSNVIFSSLSASVITGVLAFSGGTLLYLGASDLLPNVHKKTDNHSLIASIFVFTLIIVGIGKFFE
jgi:zinc transporter ZupT